MFEPLAIAGKPCFAGCSKRSRGDECDKSTSGDVLTSTLERGDRAQGSLWVFFSGLQRDSISGVNDTIAENRRLQTAAVFQRAKNAGDM